MKLGVGYTAPADTTIAWRWTPWGDSRDEGSRPPLRTFIDLTQPFHGGGDNAGMFRRYGKGRDQFLAERNGAQIINGGLNGEAQSSSTALAFEELQRRYRKGLLGSPAEYTGWPTDQEMWDLVCAEWGEGNVSKAEWGKAPVTTALGEPGGATPAPFDLRVYGNGILTWSWTTTGLKRPYRFELWVDGKPVPADWRKAGARYEARLTLPPGWASVALSAKAGDLAPSERVGIEGGLPVTTPVTPPTPEPVKPPVEPPPPDPGPTIPARRLAEALGKFQGALEALGREVAAILAEAKK